MNEKKLLASLAVFRDLYDKETDIYSIVSSFANDLIIENNLQTFSIPEFSKQFNENYEFNIPSAVIKTSLKRLKYITKNSNSYIVKKELLPTKKTLDNKLFIEDSHNHIFNELLIYVENKLNKKLKEEERKKLNRNFCNYLLDENNGDTFFEFISSFIIDNEENDNFRHKIKLIREGVILYSGVKYTNSLNDFGNWKNELNIFLDTEIIFHLLGYNGEVYKNISHDFLNFVKEINSKKRMINLFFFSEVKKEIESFFSKAKYILKGKENLNPKVTAMVEILQGCFKASDLQDKKSDMYTFLKRNQINEYHKDLDITSSENYAYNIISNETIEELNRCLEINDSESILNNLNKISILRKNKKKLHFENTKYILLSGNSKTLKAAFNTKLLEKHEIPLATNLNFIINRFWFKLNKGFSKKDFPSSFNIITKAQIILSKILNDNIGIKYDELVTKYSNGDITKEQANNRVRNLRITSKKPEEIKKELTEDVLGFISLDSIEDYIEKQNYFKYKANKYDEISGTLKNESKKNESLKKQLIEKIKKEKEKKEIIVNNFIKKEKEANNYSEKIIKKIRKCIFILILFILLTIIILIYIKGWDSMEKITYLIGIPGLLLTSYVKIFKKPQPFDSVFSSLRKFLFNYKLKKLSDLTYIIIQGKKEEIYEHNKEIVKIQESY